MSEMTLHPAETMCQLGTFCTEHPQNFFLTFTIIYANALTDDLLAMFNKQVLNDGAELFDGFHCLESRRNTNR